ncbi:MAG: GNAT family N-acetyltransferase [Maritimibacter sp.]
MSTRIRRAYPWDVAACARILWAAVEEAEWMARSRSREEERKLLARMVRQGWVRVARVEGRIVGFISVENTHVHGLYLLPNARGQGIAAQLMKTAQTKASRLTLYAHAANARARRFYAAQGFRPVAIGAGNDEGLTEIRLEWERSA